MWRYLREAFLLRWPLGPLGDIPVNAVAVTTTVVIGFLHPGFWFLGAALEAAYLLLLTLNRRFQRLIDAREREQGRGAVVARLIAELPAELRAVYDSLSVTVTKISAVRASQSSEERLDLADGETFAELLVIALRLLTAKSQLQRVIGETDEQALLTRVQELAQDHDSDVAVRQSKLATLELTRKRLATVQANRDFLRRIDADLERSEAQLTLALAEASSSGGRAPDLTIGLDLAGRLLDAGVYGDAADAVASLSLAPAAPRATVSA
jgi:hypothetical protein